MGYHNRLQHHFRAPSTEYTQISNDLIRNGSVSIGSDAYRAMSLLMSHNPDDFYESVNSMAKRYGWTWRKASRAVDELIGCRMLVVQAHVNEAGATLFETYHVNPKQFTEAEAVTLSLRVVLLNHITPSAESQKGLCEITEGASAESQNIEEQLEQQLEEKLEDAAALIAKIIPSNHPKQVKDALEKKSAELLDGGTKQWAVEAGLREWLARPDAWVGLLPHLATDALQAGPSEYVDLLQEAYDTGDVTKLALRGEIYPAPDEGMPDGLDVAGVRAWNLTKKREWVQQLMEIAR